MDERLHLPARHRRAMEALLRKHLPDIEVWAYGSRVNGRSHDGSDLDLALRGPGLKEIPVRRLEDLKEALQESNIPLLVEARDWARLPERFHREIEQDHVVLVGKPERDAGGNWPTARLGDCIEINDSTYSPKEEWPFVNYLDTGSITENRIAEIQHLIVGRDKIPSRARRKVQPGEIVYSTVRPNQRHFGLLRDVPENFLASTGFSIIRGKEGIACTDFLYWFLAQDHIVELLHTIAEHSTTAYPSIRPSDIEGLEIELPPLPEQRAIACVLGTLDDKIELNRSMNETLEAMARALFESWFVDFDPVRAKAEGRDAGLPDRIADLFPDRLVDSELGEIPEGWKVKSVSDFASIIGGKQLPKEKFIDNGSVPVFGGAGLMGYTDNCNVNGYVISVGRVGAYCGQFFSYRGPAWINNNASLITQHENVSGEWLLLALRNLDIDLIKKGAAQPFISNSDLAAMKIVAPADSTLEIFHKISEPLSRSSARIERETKTLINLRDMLILKLISGKLRLKNTEAFLNRIP